MKKTESAPTLKFSDAPANVPSSSRKRKETAEFKKQGSTSKVNKKLTVANDDMEWDDGVNAEDSCERSLTRDDGEPVDMEVVEKGYPVANDEWEVDDGLDPWWERDFEEPVDMEVAEKYLKQIEESEGFDIVDYPGNIPGITSIIPLQGLLARRNTHKERYDEIVNFATLAIGTYNKAQRTDFKVQEIEKLNMDSHRSIIYYITFSAIDPGENVAKIFQAKVEDDVIEKTFKVEFCRLAKAK